MATLFDYLDWRGDLRFSDNGLGEVDNLILSLFAYVDFDGIVLEEVGSEPPITLRAATREYLRRYKGQTAYLGKIIPPDIVSLLAKAAKTRRFANVGMIGHTNMVETERQIQFSAMTFLLDDGTSYVAFRGTDDTLVGWKENFNMSFMQPVPAQIEAVSYLERLAPHLSGDFYVGGHSKGGNLAIYAAVMCDPAWQTRIRYAYNNDGPGFDRAFVERAEYRSMSGKLCTIVPQSSVVGMLLEHEEHYEVVKSRATGLLQHNAFSWEVLGTSFVHLNTVTQESRLIDRSLKEWMQTMTPEEREHVVDSIFETLSAVGATTLTELTSEKLKLVKAWGSLDPKVRSILLKCISLIILPNKKKAKETGEL